MPQDIGKTFRYIQILYLLNSVEIYLSHEFFAKRHFLAQATGMSHEYKKEPYQQIQSNTNLTKIYN